MRAQRDSRLIAASLVIALAAIIVIGAAVLAAIRNGPLAAVTATAPVTPTGAGVTEPSIESSAIAQKQTAVATLRAFQTEHLLSNPPRPTGIFDNTDPSFLAQGYAIQNSWQQNVSGAWLQAYAGNLVNDPSQGVVLVVLAWPNRPQGRPILTPTKSGSVKIVAEHNNRLTLQADDGTVFYFDVLGMTFTPSLTEVVPTVTPLPPYTPPMPNTAAAATGYPLATATPAPYAGRRTEAT